MLVVFGVQCKMSFMQLCKAVPGNPVQHHTVLYLVQCAVCRIQCLVSCVQLEREREGGSMWSQMAPLPLINPWQSLATLGFTQHTAHWLLSVTHWTQHTEHCTQWLWSTPTRTHSQLHCKRACFYFIRTQSPVLAMHGLLFDHAATLLQTASTTAVMQNLSKMWSQDNFSAPCGNMYHDSCGKMYRPSVCDQIMPTTTHHRPGLLTYYPMAIGRS